MMSLNGVLSQASQALAADSGAIAITGNNISNVNTAGYSREIVKLSAVVSTSDPNTPGFGVSFDGYTSVRDELLQTGIQQKTSDSSSLAAQAGSWQQIEASFSSPTSGVGASLSTFFSALSASSTNPANLGVRQAAYSAASNLVEAFHQAAATLSEASQGADASIAGMVSEINGLTSRIATLDQQLASRSSQTEGGSLQDQRDGLTLQLANLIGFATTTTDSTPSLSTAGGSPLVVAGASYSLKAQAGPDGQTHILDAAGKDITADIEGGSIGGALQMRDSSIPAVTSSLDSLASQFAAAMNTAQAQGFDAAGAQGSTLFSVPAAGSMAAGIVLAIPTAAGLALSSNGSLGDSGNLAQLLAVQANALPSGLRPTDAYASLVQNIGSASADVQSAQTATGAALAQLSAQQASTSGVSIDEESVNLIRFQQAYAAAAKVVSTVNEMYSVLFNMGS